MSESTPQFNEYRKNSEQFSWTDIPGYAKEILLYNGTERPRDEKEAYMSIDGLMT